MKNNRKNGHKRQNKNYAKMVNTDYDQYADYNYGGFQKNKNTRQKKGWY